MSEVPSPVEGMVRSDKPSVFIFVAIYGGTDMGKLGKKIHGVIKVKFPIVFFSCSLLIRLEEVAVALNVEESH